MRKFKMGIFLVIYFVSQAANAEFVPIRVETGGRISCALSTQGVVKCWGNNICRELGTGDNFSYGLAPSSMGSVLPNVKLGTNVLVKDICSGNEFACAATTEGKVKCWGHNWHKYGSLGQGHMGSCQHKYGDDLPYTDLGTDFHAEHVTCGAYHACASNSKGQTKCWGQNGSGELGIGDRLVRGTEKDQMGDNLPFLASSKPIQTVAAAGGHTCVLVDNQIKCWGYGYRGTLGNEKNEISVVIGDVDSLKPVAIVAPNENIKIRKLTSHGESNCVLYKMNEQDRDHVKCWGFNDHGSLGLGDLLPRGNSANSMGANLPEVDTGFDFIADIQSHGRFACALSTKGQVKCWGINEVGQLGLGHTADRGGLPNEMGKNLSVIDLGLPVKALSAGGSRHSCAILINNQIKCWGFNESGQLGYEDGADRGASSKDMGDQLPFVRLN